MGKPVLGSLAAGVEINFVASTSEDVESHTIFKKGPENDAWEVFLKLGTKATFFKDTLVKEGVHYEYTILATDDSNNDSEKCNSVNLKPYPTGLISGSTPIASYIVENDQISITWDEQADTESNLSYVLFKSTSDNNWKYLTKVKGNEYLDQDIDTSVNPQYKLKVYSDDGESLPRVSNIVTFN